MKKLVHTIERRDIGTTHPLGKREVWFDSLMGKMSLDDLGRRIYREEDGKLSVESDEERTARWQSFTLGPRTVVRLGAASDHSSPSFVMGPHGEVLGRFAKYADAVLDSAAPAMLDALIRAELWIATQPDHDAMAKIIRAAIAKAGGKAP